MKHIQAIAAASLFLSASAALAWQVPHGMRQAEINELQSALAVARSARPPDETAAKCYIALIVELRESSVFTTPVASSNAQKQCSGLTVQLVVGALGILALLPPLPRGTF